MARHERILPAVRAMARDGDDEDPVRDIGDDEEDEQFDDAEEEDLDEEDDDNDIVDEDLERDSRPTSEVGSEGGSAGTRSTGGAHARPTEGSEATETGRPSSRKR